MDTRCDHDVTDLLTQWRGGSAEAESRLLAVVLPELRRIASAYLRRERPGHAFQPTALINEAYLRLVGRRRIRWENRAHFYGIAAQVMRRVLVDYARKRDRQKRGGGVAQSVTLSEVVDTTAKEDLDVLSLHEALTDLAALDARQGHIITLRYFGGLTVDEIAEFQTISPATVKRELATAKLWLRHRMQHRTPTPR